MGGTFDRRGVRRMAVGTVAAFGLLGIAGTAAVSGGVAGGETVLAVLRSAAHVLGLGSSLLLAYYAGRARRRFAGGAFGTSATYTLVGASLFAVAFLVMELDHGFGVDILAFVGDMQLRMALSMALFTGTVFAFGLAYYRLADALEGV